jgi:hypothetical protein
MSAEPPVNSFRAAVLSGRAGKHDDIIKTAKESHADSSVEGLGMVQIPRAEHRQSNQREGDRHRLSAEEAILTGPHGETIVEVVNLSAGGAMIRTNLELMLFDHVGLIIGGDDVIDCAVRWIKGDRVGLEFAEETRLDGDREAVDSLLRNVIKKSFPDLAGDPLYRPTEETEDGEQDDEQAHRRVAERHPLIWNGIVHQEHDSETVRLRNISVTGALVQSSTGLPQGATVYLDLGGAGILEAVVKWTRGAQSGLAFTEPFDIQKLAAARPNVADNEPSHGTQSSHGQPSNGSVWNRRTIDDLASELGG